MTCEGADVPFIGDHVHCNLMVMDLITIHQLQAVVLNMDTQIGSYKFIQKWAQIYLK